MKKIFITIIAMLLPLMASADDSGTCGENLTWSYVEYTRTLTISGTGAMDNYEYSSNLSPWNDYKYKIYTLIIEYGITYIGNYAFNDCSSLTSITIPNSVTSIGDRAFHDCHGLTSITIPNSVTSIGSHAFSYCRSLTSVTISNSVTSIGNYAFYECNSLTSITIPNSVTSIGGHAFSGCGSLTSITVEDGNMYYDSRNNCNAIIHKRTNILVKGCENTTIPNSVTGIGQGAFYKCRGLTSITIPNSVTDIGWYAFEDCSGLTSITIPNSVTSIGARAFDSCSGLTSITIPNSVTYIESYAFSDCGSLTSITVEDGNMYYDSRNNCNAIIRKQTNTLIAGCKNTTIPSSVTSIGQGAFSDCSGLTSITIPYGVKSIGRDAFFRCSGLTSITIPNSVMSIGGSAFDYTKWYNNQPNGLVYAGKFAYKYKGIMPDNTSITINEGTLGIAGDAFSNCSGLTSITIPNSVTSIGSSAFDGTGWYNNQPDGLVYAGKVAYKYKGIMPDNTSITIKEGTQGIADEAFSSCSGLTSFTIPNSVTSIGNRAFYKCSVLTSITIPNSVTSIGEEAFDYCYGLVYICLKSDTYPSSYDLGNTTCQYILPQKAYEGGIPYSVTNYATYSKTPMLVKVKSKTATSASFELRPVDNPDYAVYIETTYGQTPGQDLRWKLNDQNYGIVSSKADDLTLEVQAAEAMSTTKARLSATVKEPNDDKHYGFEWRRIGVDDLVPSNVVYSQLYDGHIVGTLNNLNPDIAYKYRPFYKSDSGDMFYGEWIGFLTGDANVFFEPEVHTKEPVALTKDGAQLSGVWVEGTEDIQEKGFEYWPKNSGARPVSATRGSNVTAIIVKGNNTSVTLEGLEAGTEYVYRSYLRTASGTIYGEEMTFKTPLMGDANNDGKVNVADIVEVVNAKAGKPSASFNLTNADTDGNGTLTEADITAIANKIMKK